MKFGLERISQKKAKITEKIDDLNLQLDNAQKESKRIVVNKQVKNNLFLHADPLQFFCPTFHVHFM
jgi:hypothetical protein